ncbi:MAG: hypothetical protein HPY61_03225 [Methanotrichaceae archaeon]|nr:hypothetical protein [Methanotrichaceae archaeon]
MRSLLILSALILLSSSLAMALVDLNNLQSSIDSYNQKIDQAPSVLKALLGDERMDITILLNNSSTIQWGFETRDAKIVRAESGVIENPTIEVYAQEDAIRRIENSNDPAAAYKEAEKAGQVKIQGNTLGARLKLAAALSSGEAIKIFFSIL